MRKFILINCDLSFISVTVLKYPTQTILRRNGFVWVTITGYHCMKVKELGHHLHSSSWTEENAHRCTYCSSCSLFSYTIKGSVSRNGVTHSRLGLSTPIKAIETTPTDMFTSHINLDHLSLRLFPGGSTFCRWQLKPTITIPITENS